jgi:predicted dienelactone hydrolase
MLLLLAACAHEPGDSADDDVPWVAPDEAGPWQAGTYADRFTGQTGETLTVQVWYPTAETDGDLHVYDDLVEGGALDEPAPACDGARPVVVFSHGNSGVRWQSTFLTEHLASQGFVVVAPDHVHNTAFDIDEDRTGEVMLRRPLDVADAFDWLVETAAGPGGPLEGCVDGDDGYAVAGHSFGGFTTHAVAGAVLDVEASATYCAQHDDWLCGPLAEQAALTGASSFDLGDPRVWAAVPQCAAGYEVTLAGLGQIDVPLLAMGADLDTLTPMDEEVRPAYEAAERASPRYLATLSPAGHFTYSNFCDWFGTYEECAAPYIDPADAYPIIRTTVSAFLRTVRGDEDARDWLPPETTALSWEEG